MLTWIRFIYLKIINFVFYRKALRHTYDYIFSLDSEELKSVAGHTSTEEFSLIFAFTLQSFEKLAWLSPNMIAAKNCDEIFDLMEQSNTFSYNKHFSCLPNMDLSLCLLKPSVRMFDSILESLQSDHIWEGFQDFLKTWLTNQDINQVDNIDAKYKLFVPYNASSENNMMCVNHIRAYHN